MAIRSLHNVSVCLTSRPEQDEVFSIFDRIRKETGWRIDFIYDDLRKKWGHDKPEEMAMQPFNNFPGGGSSLPPAPPIKMPPVGIINPMYAKADFARTDGPYGEYYVAPIPHPPVQPPNVNSVFHTY